MSEKANSTQGVRLHLGCGDIHLDGWINVDARKTPAVDLVARLHDLPFAAGSISQIYACHVLEHFGFGVARPTYKEVLVHWVSKLSPGGVLFVSVPNIAAVGRAISKALSVDQEYDFMRCLYGGCDYETNRHFVGFTERLLYNALREAGLSGLSRFSPFANDTSTFSLHNTFVSLNVKGTK